MTAVSDIIEDLNDAKVNPRYTMDGDEEVKFHVTSYQFNKGMLTIETDIDELFYFPINQYWDYTADWLLEPKHPPPKVTEPAPRKLLTDILIKHKTNNK